MIWFFADHIITTITPSLRFIFAFIKFNIVITNSNTIRRPHNDANPCKIYNTLLRNITLTANNWRAYVVMGRNSCTSCNEKNGQQNYDQEILFIQHKFPYLIGAIGSIRLNGPFIDATTVITAAGNIVP